MKHAVDAVFSLSATQRISASAHGAACVQPLHGNTTAMAPAALM